MGVFSPEPPGFLLPSRYSRIGTQQCHQITNDCRFKVDFRFSIVIVSHKIPFVLKKAICHAKNTLFIIPYKNRKVKIKFFLDNLGGYNI